LSSTNILLRLDGPQIAAIKTNKSYIAGLVHVGEQSGDGHVADGLLEEHLLDGGGGDGAQRGEQQEQLPEATRLSGVPVMPPTGWGRVRMLNTTIFNVHETSRLGCMEISLG